MPRCCRCDPGRARPGPRQHRGCETTRRRQRRARPTPDELTACRPGRERTIPARRGLLGSWACRSASDRWGEDVKIAVGAHHDERVGGAEASAGHKGIQSAVRCGRRNCDPARSADSHDGTGAAFGQANLASGPAPEVGSGRPIRSNRDIGRPSRVTGDGRTPLLPTAALCNRGKASILSALLQLAQRFAWSPLLERTVRLPSVREENKGVTNDHRNYQEGRLRPRLWIHRRRGWEGILLPSWRPPGSLDFDRLVGGERVSFEIETSPKGPRAIQVSAN